ncbi:transcriptional regulator [Erythrobacter gaetbuli]|uniref:Transcriptional regulator n=1 Tax=Qipengyuania gaetbuli TaxID=266952 RepID=A0A844XZ12_9SPHN|nr:MucR family transcriptional regulator [Qipengyuania gaetbuli]MXO50142.1 transcriptional regulator [Qipengyuania gaetbuli]
MEKENLIILTGDIASAYVANNEIGFESVGRLVTDIHGALALLGQQANEVEPAEPVVSVRASLKNEHLVCLACGRKMKTLKRHLANEHGMTPQEYRDAYKLPADYPLVAPAYAKARSEHAKKIGLGKNPNQKRGRKPADKKAKAND